MVNVLKEDGAEDELLLLESNVAEVLGAGVTLDEEGPDENTEYGDDVAPAADNDTGADDDTEEVSSKGDDDDVDDDIAEGVAVEDDMASGGVDELFDAGTEDDESGGCADGPTFIHICTE